MTRPRVTLSDVATRAGVSRTTASFVLTGRRDMRISSEAQSRVLRAARELDYRPNLLARSLRTNSSQTIGLLSDSIATDTFAGEVIRGSTAAALLHQHLMFIGETGGDPELENSLVENMLDRGVAGFIYAAMYTKEVRLSKVLRAHRLVLLNCVTKSQRIPTVVPDDRGAGRSAAQVLIAAGHREGIFLVGEGPPHVMAAVERLAGVTDSLTAARLSLGGTVDCLWWPEPAYSAVSEFLASGAEPSALICLNDRIALGAYQALADAGLRIPADVSVVSFDDSDLAFWMRPQLTSVGIPYYDLGRRAVELLLTPEDAASPFTLTMPLRERESVGPPALRRQTRRLRRKVGGGRAP